MHDQQRLIMAHSIRTRTFLSASCFHSATLRQRARRATSSWTSRFLSRLLRASDFDRGESPQGETSYVYPPTYLPTYLPLQHNTEPFCKPRVDKPHRITPLPQQVFLLRRG